jgi:serine/threonine protein kinase
VIGQTISHYKILDKIGEGGMGVVYKALDTKLDRTVALKFLPLHLTKSEEDKLRFIREAKAAGALNHPHICTIYSVEEYEGQQFISMEYVDGVTLREKIESSPLSKGGLQGGLSLDTAMSFALQIAEALSEAHEKGIVHRDIKPENLMVDSKNRIRVMDFGLAKLKEEKNLTKTGSTVGTVAYMSPEQIQGDEVDHRSDIFSFGVVLYEMLTGKTPFRGEHEAAMMYSIVNEEPIPIQGEIAEQYPQLIYILERTIEKYPEDRYQSITDLVGDLKRLKKRSSKRSQAIYSPAETPSYSEAISREVHGTTTVDTKPSYLTKKKSLLVTVLILILVGIGSLIYFFPFGETTIDSNSVVVAVFENRSGNPAYDHHGRTIADRIIDGIVQTDVADVVPAEITFALADETEQAITNPAHLARQANAGIVVSGSYTVSDGVISIDARVIDVPNGKLVFAFDPQRDSLDELHSVTDNLRDRILGGLVFIFDDFFHGFNELFNTPPTYSSAMEYWRGHRRFLNRDYEAAINHFNTAYSIDSTNTYALVLSTWGYKNLGRPEDADSVIQYIETLDKNLSSAGEGEFRVVKANIRGENLSALRELREILLITGRSDQLYLLGLFASRVNRPYEAIEALTDRGLLELIIERFDQWFFYWGVLSGAYHMIGDHELELVVAREGREILPDNLSTLSYEMRALAALGKIDVIHDRIQEALNMPSLPGGTPAGVLRNTAIELRAHGYSETARELLEEAIRWYRARSPGEFHDLRSAYGTTLYHARRWRETLDIFNELVVEEPGNVTYRGYLGVVNARLGNTERAKEISEWIGNVNDPYQRGVHTQWRARIASVLGEQERALSLLRDAFREGLGYGPWLHADPAFESLHDYSSFQRLLEPRG